MDHAVSIRGELAYLLGVLTAAFGVNNNAHVIFDEAQDGDILSSCLQEGAANDIVPTIPFSEHRYATPAGAQV